MPHIARSFLFVGCCAFSSRRSIWLALGSHALSSPCYVCPMLGFLGRVAYLFSSITQLRLLCPWLCCLFRFFLVLVAWLPSLFGSPPFIIRFLPPCGSLQPQHQETRRASIDLCSCPSLSLFLVAHDAIFFNKSIVGSLFGIAPLVLASIRRFGSLPLYERCSCPPLSLFFIVLFVSFFFVGRKWFPVDLCMF